VKFDWLAVLKNVASFVTVVAKDVAPGVVTEADAAFHAICQLVEAVAHPNTIAYKIAHAATDKASELGL